MITTFNLAGFFAAHAIWCVSDGESLTPMLAYLTEDDEQKMERLVSDSAEVSVAHGREKLVSNEMDANDAALLYDGRLQLDTEKLDAILIEMRCYFSPTSEAILAIPYTPKTSAGGTFLVHKPKLLEWQDCDGFDLDAAFESFFDGVAAHEKGSEIWDKCLDESK